MFVRELMNCVSKGAVSKLVIDDRCWNVHHLFYFDRAKIFYAVSFASDLDLLDVSYEFRHYNFVVINILSLFLSGWKPPVSVEN